MDQVKIVDALSASANVLLDLNDATWVTMYESDLTPPALSRALVSNMMTDGSYVAASTYPDRVIKLVLEVVKSTADTLALEIQKIARCLDRPEGTTFLKWQPEGATYEVYFPLKRSEFGSIREVVGGKRRLVQVNLNAGPFALGLPEGPTAYTLNFDPAAGSNPTYFDVTGVKGDVETPLYMTIQDSDLSAQIVAMAVRSRGTPSNVTWFRQAEALTLGTDASVPGTDANASGATNDYVRVSFGTTTTMATRISGTFPTTGAGNTDWHGKYRVLARMRRSSGSISVQILAGTATALDDVEVESASWYVYDLGVVQFPTANTGYRAGYGAAHPTAGVTLAVQAERLSGAGNLDIDYIALVPADQHFAIAKLTSMASSRICVIDGPNNAIYRLNSSSELDSSATTGGYFDGRLPHVDPRATTNRVFMHPGVLDLDLTEASMAAAATINVTYWPRYLYVRPAST